MKKASVVGQESLVYLSSIKQVRVPVCCLGLLRQRYCGREKLRSEFEGSYSLWLRPVAAPSSRNWQVVNVLSELVMETSVEMNKGERRWYPAKSEKGQ